MNQHDLAIKLGVSKQIVSRWVNNQTLMSFENAYRVSKILKVSMEELYEWR